MKQEPDSRRAAHSGRQGENPLVHEGRKSNESPSVRLKSTGLPAGSHTIVAPCGQAKPPRSRWPQRTLGLTTETTRAARGSGRRWILWSGA
jgi:hypothetical protein